MNRRRTWLAAGGAFLVVVGTLAVILVFGQLMYPAFPRLPDEDWGAPDGRIAFTRSAWNETCVFVVPAAGGSERELRCGSDWYSWPTWTEDGLIAISSYSGPSPQQIVLDPETGEIVRTEDEEPDRGRPLPVPGAPGSSNLVVSSTDGVVQLSVTGSGSPEPVLEVEGPRDYNIWQVSWSPDERWILAVDSAQRALIVDPNGSGTRLLAEDVQQASWYQEGEGATSRATTPTEG